ncbi:redoxin domain-containing protein [Acrasis kona]|uniref:Redoxin domain-containing protein n=1 Tax=Acrasis kona TaxID=1008807 RepID=A0AAW2YNP5_9EUKA
MNMLEKLNAIVDDVHALNGEVFAVSSQNAAARNIINSLKLSFNVLDDERGAIAKSLGVKLCKDQDPAVSGLVKLLKQHNGDRLASRIEQKYPSGMVQPAIVIVRRDGEVVYKWISNPMERNAYGTFQRMDIPHVRTIIKFLESIQKFIRDNKQIVFDSILKNQELKDMFKKSLNVEKYPELLIFVETMMDINDIESQADTLYNRFLLQTSPESVDIDEQFRERYLSIQSGDRNNEDVVALLKDVYENCVGELMGNRLNNFVKSPDFVQEGVKLLPFTFTVSMDLLDKNSSDVGALVDLPKKEHHYVKEIINPTIGTFVTEALAVQEKAFSRPKTRPFTSHSSSTDIYDVINKR